MFRVQSEALSSVQYDHNICRAEKERVWWHSYLLCWALPFNFWCEVYVSWCIAECSVRSLGSLSTHRCIAWINRDSEEKQNIVFWQYSSVGWSLMAWDIKSCSAVYVLSSTLLLQPQGFLPEFITLKYSYIEIYIKKIWCCFRQVQSGKDLFVELLNCKTDKGVFWSMIWSDFCLAMQV